MEEVQKVLKKTKEIKKILKKARMKYQS